jgi:hypothetical protein
MWRRLWHALRSAWGRAAHGPGRAPVLPRGRLASPHATRITPRAADAQPATTGEIILRTLRLQQLSDERRRRTSGAF